MKATDVMVRDVVTVKPETDVATAIKLLVEHDISALPVVDQTGTVIGVISEADLVRRAEIRTEKQRPWWLEALTPGSILAEEFPSPTGGPSARSCRPTSFRHPKTPRLEKSPRCWKGTASSAFPSSRTAS
jgi:CBS domain